MDEDDPEKRIAELERQLSDAKPVDPGTPLPPQEYSPYPTGPGPQEYPTQPGPPQQAWYPPPSVNWQQPQQRYRRLPFSMGALVIPGIVALVALGAVVAVAMGVNPFASKKLQTADGLNGLLNDIRKKFGDTTGYELVVYPDHAVIDRVDPQDSRVEKSYIYDGNDWSDFGHPSSPMSSESVVDLSTFDAAGVAATIAKAPQTLTITNPDVSYLIVEGRSGGGTSYRVYTSDGLSAYMDINANGTVKQVHPPS